MTDVVPLRHVTEQSLGLRLDSDERDRALEDLRMRVDVDHVVPCHPVPRWPTVMVDGVPYASFRDLGHAIEAIEAWRKKWPAVAGRDLSLVDALEPSQGSAA